MEYLVIFETAVDGTIWARVPELEGCYSCGQSLDEAKRNIQEAIQLYIDDLKEDGKPIPQPRLRAELVEVSA